MASLHRSVLTNFVSVVDLRHGRFLASLASLQPRRQPILTGDSLFMLPQRHRRVNSLILVFVSAHRGDFYILTCLPSCVNCLILPNTKAGILWRKAAAIRAARAGETMPQGGRLYIVRH